MPSQRREKFATVTAARPPPSFVPLVRRLQPVVNLPLGFVLGIAVALLQPSRQLLALALDDAEVIAGELAPFLLNLAFELGPIAFDPVPIHRSLSCGAENPEVIRKPVLIGKVPKSEVRRSGQKNRGVADLQIGYARDHRPSTGRGKGRPVVLTMRSAAVGSAGK